MRTPSHPRVRPSIALLLAVLVTAAVAFVAARDRAPAAIEASSHREAPSITEDPTADNTDVYAFVSTESGRADFVTLIANWIPFQEPNQGPNYYRFSDNVRYAINVDTNGDAIADLIYQLDFRTIQGAITPNTFLYNVDRIGPPPNPGDPTSQYTNLNVPQSYTLTELRRPPLSSFLPPGVSLPPGAMIPPGVSGPTTTTVLLQNARTAPYHIGPRSTGTEAEYAALADAAILPVAGVAGMRAFAGVRDEGFYIDLAAGFDLFNFRNPGVDGTSGVNVHTVALEIPKSRFAAAGDTDSRIGVWATASRRSAVAGLPLPITPPSAGGFVQVSRLATPLVNELLIPLRSKDVYNATEPRQDSVTIRDLIVNPGTSQGPAAFVPLLNRLTGGCTAVTNRADLEAIVLLGIPGGLVPGFPGNRETQTANPVPADLIRLNYSVAPAASPNRLGLLGGDIAGFPNGRRVPDDVTDIALRATGGELQPLVGLPACPPAATLTDRVDGNDRPYLSRFPYLAVPHQGYTHEHDHASP